MKNSNQNVDSFDHPDGFMVTFPKGFSDIYGDRSGVVPWGFNADKNTWWVKQRSGSTEYYKKMKDFGSCTKVDLSDLINAPFHNPTHERWVFDFWTFYAVNLTPDVLI